MPALHCSVYYRPDALPAAQPTALKAKKYLIFTGFQYPQWLVLFLLTAPTILGLYAFSSSSLLLKIKYGKWKRENMTETRMEYKKSRHNAKRVISSAKEKKRKECANDLNDSECQNEIFLMAKQMVKERQDITGLNCIKGASGKVIVDGKGIKDSWKEYMEKLMNEWDHKISAEVKEGPMKGRNKINKFIMK